MSLEAAAERAVRSCEKLRASEAEAYLQRTLTIEVVVEHGGIKSERVKSNQGMGIRFIKDKRLGFAFTSDLSKKNIDLTCKTAMKLSKTTVPDPNWVSLPTIAKHPKTPSGIFDPKVAALSGTEVLSLYTRAYDAAKECSKKVVIDDAKFSSLATEIALSNSHGINAVEKSTLLYGYILCSAKEHGQASSFAYEYHVTRDSKFSPEELGRSAAEKAAASTGPKKGEPFIGKVILDTDPAAEILFYPIFYSVNADNVQRKRSTWIDKMDKPVAVSELNVTDDGLLPRGIGSSSFDAEGVPSRRTSIIAKGMLKGFLHSSYTANKEKKKSTGNAGRDNYNTIPAVQASNLIVEPGKKNLNDIVSDVEKGIIVRRFSGNVLPDSGEFSGIAKQANYIEHGEIKHALKETMISGNAFQSLMNIVEVGRESRPTFQRIYTPPILLDKVNIVSK